MTPSQPLMPGPKTSNAVPESLLKIRRFVVLMLENRSFDHLVGYMKADDPRVAGLSGTEGNYPDPNAPVPPPITVRRATRFVMPFDPNHEFEDVEFQLYGPNRAQPPAPNPPSNPAAMNGFLYSAAAAARGADVPGEAYRVMECFQPDQVTVISTLAREFALFNFWYSSLPGPTWPNRFFVHAATSGGLTDSPDDERILAGFWFKSGTIYERLETARCGWRIYHDGLPQTAGIDSLRLEYIKWSTTCFREMKFFDQDVNSGLLPEYTFIEPRYDTGHNYLNGNSMHPLNDIRKGELLVKHVYETLRNSPYWGESILIITFDEHGGFYDRISPPATVPTGDDLNYSNPSHPFGFDRLGVRVPAILVSAFTQRGTVVGTDPTDPTTTFDHSSIPATVEKRFGLEPLTARDRAANTLDIALNQASPRLSPADAPTTLPDPVADTLTTRIATLFQRMPAAARDDAPLSRNQKSQLALALACDIALTDPAQHRALRARHDTIRRQEEAAEYMREVETKIHSRRSTALSEGPPKGGA